MVGQRVCQRVNAEGTNRPKHSTQVRFLPSAQEGVTEPPLLRIARSTT